MKVLIDLNDQQWTWIQDIAKQTGATPFGVLHRTLELGQPVFQKLADQVPKAPRVLRLVRKEPYE